MPEVKAHSERVLSESCVEATRLPNAFSKKWENRYAALALYFAYYNFVRIHSTLRVTSAMEAGLTDHTLTLKELLGNVSA